MATPGAEALDIIPSRTLRRAAAEGLVRAAGSRRRSALASAEVDYLRQHWEVLSALRRTLRTERSVGAAVVFGSFARGDDGPTSDIDVAVLFRGPMRSSGRLRNRLSAATGRRVDIVDWDALRQAPEMALAVARDGRPLVDRAGAFAEIRADRENARRRAARLQRRQWDAIERLWGD